MGRVTIVLDGKVYHDLGGLEEIRLLLEREKEPPLLITHNKDVVFLQFNGWSINLYSDGQWVWEDTTGG